MEKEKTELPTNPGHMPLKFLQNMEWLRHAFYDLQSMADDVEIRFEASTDECGCDDSDGIWEVEVSSGPKRFTAKHERIENALWFVLEHLNAKDRTDYENRERKRREALSKLSVDERRLLGLRAE